MIARDLQETTRETDGKKRERERGREVGDFSAYNFSGAVVKMGNESDCMSAGCVIS